MTSQPTCTLKAHDDHMPNSLYAIPKRRVSMSLDLFVFIFMVPRVNSPDTPDFPSCFDGRHGD